MRSSLRSPKIIKKRRRKTFLKVLFIFAGALGLVFGPSLLTKSEYLQIKNIKIEGASSVSTQEISKISESLLSGNYLGLYSKSNIVLYPKRSIEKKILSQIPRIHIANVALSGLDEISIFVEERNPRYVWCRTESSDCFFLDEEGYVFDEAPNFSAGVYVVFRGESKEDFLGSFAFSKDQFDNLKNFLDGLKILSINPSSVLVEKDEIEIIFSGDSRILIRLDDDLDKSLSNLESVLNDPKLEIRTGDDSDISYIDLRFGNKVFYKRQ